MLRPSYSELMEVLNNDINVDTKITSRYIVVVAAAKRARQLINGERPLTTANTDKAVSIAVNEMYNGNIRIKNNMENKAAYKKEMEGYIEDDINSFNQ